MPTERCAYQLLYSFITTVKHLIYFLIFRHDIIRHFQLAGEKSKPSFPFRLMWHKIYKWFQYFMSFIDSNA